MNKAQIYTLILAIISTISSLGSVAEIVAIMIIKNVPIESGDGLTPQDVQFLTDTLGAKNGTVAILLTILTVVATVLLYINVKKLNSGNQVNNVAYYLISALALYDGLRMIDMWGDNSSVFSFVVPVIIILLVFITLNCLDKEKIVTE